MIDRLHLVDGTYELFRAHYSKRPEHLTPEGQPVKATLGLGLSLLALLKEDGERATHVAVAFDNPIRSFRNRLFDGYKSDEGVPPELRAQFDLAEALTQALGFTVWRMDEHEADDALATGAARFAEHVEQVRICTPDKDLGQCLLGERVVQVYRTQEKVVDEAAFRAKLGIAPRSVPDFLALTGDDADGIPGLPGWGEKSAAAVLARYPHLEDIPSDPRTWDVKVRGAEKLSAALEANREAARLYRTLATLVTDVPLKETFEDLEWRGAHREPLRAIASKLGTSQFDARPDRFR